MTLLRRLVVVAFFSGALSANPIVSQAMAQGPGVSQEGAWTLFKNGAYTQARDAFRALLKQNSLDSNARLGLARAIYHLEDWSGAHEAFRGVSLTTLDPEASYEYGQTMFRFEHYDEALTAFRRVPVAHALRDLAAYYAGVSAMRLKRHQEAADRFEAALTLPEPLRKNRALYVRHVQDQLTRRERRRLARERGDEGTVVEEDSGKYRHAGFYYIDPKAIIGTENKKQVARYHGLREETNRFSTRYFHFENGLIHPLTKAGERRSAVGVLVELDAEHKDFDGLERSLDRVPDVTNRATEFSKTGSGSAILFSEWALPHSYWLNLEGAFEQEYPDFGKKLSYSTRSGGFGIGQRKSGYQARFLAHILETLNARRDVTMTEARYSLESFSVPWDFLELFVVGESSVFEYHTSGIDGPTGRVRLDVEAKFLLPWALTFLVQGRFERHSGFVMHEVADLPSVTFAKDGARGVAMLYVEPLSWIRIGARVEEERQWLRGFDSAGPAVEDEVKQVEASHVLETAVYGELNLFF